MTASGLKFVTSPKPIVFCDFDGTITLSDVTDEILTRLAAPAWRDVEQLWIEGCIGSRECLERQLALVKTSAKELNELIDSIPLDPHYPEFVRFIHSRWTPYIVLSDGLDYVIRRVLKRSGLGGRLRNGSQFFSSAGHLRDGGLAVTFPHATSSCAHGCATCKPLIVRRLKRDHWPVLYVGDGLSDRYAVREADFVYARKPLLDYCHEADIPCRAFETFADIECALRRWLGGRAAVEGRETARGRLLPVPAE